jgi:predicted amidohydrolase
VASLVDEEATRGTDVILLPELARGLDHASEESLPGPTITAMSGLTKKHKTYVACSIDRKDGNRRLNSSCSSTGPAWLRAFTTKFSTEATANLRASRARLFVAEG